MAGGKQARRPGARGTHHPELVDPAARRGGQSGGGDDRLVLPDGQPAVTLPPTAAGIVSMRASGAASTAAIAWLADWDCRSSCRVVTCVTSRKTTAAARARIAAMPAWDGLISRERPVRPPRWPASASGPRPRGGSCLVSGAAASTRARISPGDSMAVAIATITPAMTGGTYRVNGTDVVCGHVQTANATVYIISSVLMPSS